VDDMMSHQEIKAAAAALQLRAAISTIVEQGGHSEESADKIMELILDWATQGEFKEGAEPAPEPVETRTDYCARMGFDM
jgi:hypothetical protein